MKRRISQGQAMRSTGSAARDPHRAAFVVARRQLVGADERLIGLLPGFETTFEGLRVDAVVPQPCGSSFAQLLPALANDDDAFAEVVLAPGSDTPMIPPQRARDKSRIRAIVVIDAHIDNRWAVRQTDKLGELL